MIRGVNEMNKGIMQSNVHYHAGGAPGANSTNYAPPTYPTPTYGAPTGPPAYGMENIDARTGGAGYQETGTTTNVGDTSIKKNHESG